MDLFEGLYVKLVEYQKNHVWLFLAVLFAITGFMLFHALQLQQDTTLDQQLVPEDDFLTYREFMAREFGQTNTFFVVVRTDEKNREPGSPLDLRNANVIQAMDELEASLADEGSISSTVSIAGVLKRAFGRLPATDAEARAWIGQLGPEVRRFYSKDFSATIVSMAVNVPDKPGATEQLEKRLRERVDEAPFPIGIRANLTGNLVLLNEILHLMISDAIFTLGIAVLFVSIINVWLFRRFSYVFISILPVVVAVIWLVGTMKLTGIRLSVANATVAAMVIGLGVDYAIHVTNSFDTNVRKHVRQPITKTMAVAGSALFVSFLTTLVGFSVNLLGTTEATRVQGLTLAIGVTYSFLVTMLLVPPLLKLKIDILREEEGLSKWK